MKRFNPSNIIVKFTTGRYEGRIQNSLSFQAEYAPALRAALNAVKAGHTNVELIQYREVIHTHSQLAHALENLNPLSTDEEVIEQVHHSSHPPHSRILMHLMQYAQCASPVIWANS